MSASGGQEVPADVTEEVIKNTKGVNALSQLAQRFSPPVSTEHCMNVDQKRERLMCAYRKAKQVSRDVESFGGLMEELKKSDGKMRERLLQLFVHTQQLLEEIVQLEPVIDKQLQQEDSTRDYQRKIDTFMRLLNQTECPVVVAGQISSGKSTLLNLFLGTEVLPTDLLSCTATICELIYSPTTRAELLHEDGSLEPIEFEDKDKYIFKSDEREQRFSHEGVRLHMPVPFLKSGITLVDTPGVGENKEMWEVLYEYVTKKNVFGFIFAIKCDDSGGVLSRFKEMLRQLSMIKDEQGQFKFDPKSIIFVANFWDKVKKEDKATVQKGIEEALEREPCLKGIKVENQLFFVNSRFAWHTWGVGLISDDYEKLIRAVERFFPIGHKRKLKLSYMWLENLLLRVQHPVQAFLNKAVTSTNSLDKGTGKALKKLLITEEGAKTAKQNVREFFEHARSTLLTKVEDFLRLESTRKRVCTWMLGDIPKEEFGDTWILIEERLDQVIDARVSSVLQEWEVGVKNFERTEEHILQRIRFAYADVFANLEELEKMLRDMSGDKQEKQEGAQRSSSLVEETATDAKPREFKVDVAHEFSVLPMAHQILNNLFSNPASLFRMGHKAKQKLHQKDAETYQANKVKYMEERAGLVFSRLKDSEQTIRQLVDEQLRTAEKSMEFVYSNAMGLIGSNRSLTSELQSDRREKPQLTRAYRPAADRLNEVLEAAISFMYENIYDYDFPEDYWQAKQQTLPRVRGSGTNCPLASVVSGMFPVTDHSHKKEAVAKQLQPGSTFTRRHLFSMACNMRALTNYKQAKDYIPALMGVARYQREPALMFSGTMITARDCMLSGSRGPGGAHKRAAYINQELKLFIMCVSKAVEFLHIKRLVHIELSLDSVMMQANKPRLSNIFESQEVPYPADSDTLTGNFVYMAPETFPINGSKRYTDKADVYALGLMLLELWVSCDLYKSTPQHSDLRRNQGPKEWLLHGFMQEPDPGAKLFQRVELFPEAQMHLPKAMIQKCLHANPRDRCTIREWIRELDQFNRTNLRFEAGASEA